MENIPQGVTKFSGRIPKIITLEISKKIARGIPKRIVGEIYEWITKAILKETVGKIVPEELP